MTDIRPDILAAKDATLARLKGLHDDFQQTVLLWQELLIRHRYGMPQRIFKSVKTGKETGTVQQWTQQARESQAKLRVRTFKDLSNEVELFVDVLLRIWLMRFPKLVEAKSSTLSEILAGKDLDDLKSRARVEAVEETILQKLKERPWYWFNYLAKNCGVNIAKSDLELFVERKAARDTLEHHDGEVDEAYLAKAASGKKYGIGELIEPNDDDIDALFDLVFRLIERIAQDAVTYFLTADANS